MILDIHSHRPAPYQEGIVNIMSASDEALLPGQFYSVGIHPWDTDKPAELLPDVSQLAANPAVVAIGECGLDPLRGGPMFRQLQHFKMQVDLSERVAKPLVIHAVKSADLILGLKRDLNPTQTWIIHGFRGKPALAGQLTAKGIFLSFGERFNAETLKSVPEELLLAETDESVLSIEEIVARLSEVRGKDLTEIIAANTARVLALDAE